MSNNVQLPEWSEPLFDESRELRYYALHGGRGSGKSRTMATLMVLQAAQKPCRILCTREVQKSIRDSVKRLLDDEIERLGFRDMFKSTDTEIRGSNGSLIIFAGLRHDIDSIKSMEGITHCWVEEAQTISQNSIETLDPTIRAPGSKLYFTWNPKSPKDPIDVMFRGEAGAPPKSIVLQVNFDDNPWFPQELRDQMEHMKATDYGRYKHVFEGDYLVRSNANVIQNWRIEEFEAPEDAFFRFGCDWGFSVDPTCLIRCYTINRNLYIDYEAYMIGCEIDDTPALFAEVPKSDEYPIIADSASPERISYMRKHGYPKMMKALKGRKSIEEGINFLQSHNIIVHPRCENMIRELMSYKYKMDPVTNEVSNVLEDKNNHCIAEGTLISTPTGLQKIETIAPGERVLTRGGYKSVLDTLDHGIKQVVHIRTERGTLTCTPDHRVLTNYGWLRADALRYNMDVLYIEEHPCSQSELSGEGLNTEGIQTPTTPQTGTTLREHFLEALLFCIGMFGSITTVPFLTGTTFTMWTETLPITLFLIYAVLTQVITSGSTGPMRGVRSCWHIWTAFAHLLKRGIPHQKGISGINRTGTTHGMQFQNEHRSASIAPMSSPIALSSLNDSARTSVSQPGEEIKDWMMLTAHAPVVGQCLESISIGKRKLVPVRVQTVLCGTSVRVYDLSVEDHHEFFANGVLVENCFDSLRYSLEAVRRTVRKANPKLADFSPIPSVSHWG